MDECKGARFLFFADLFTEMPQFLLSTGRFIGILRMYVNQIACKSGKRVVWMFANGMKTTVQIAVKNDSVRWIF